MNFDGFVKRIEEMSGKPENYFIVDPELPLSIFFSQGLYSHSVLRIEDIGYVLPPSLLSSTEQIEVQSYDEQGKAILQFCLVDPKARELFNVLCYDLIESSRKDDKSNAIASLVQRFKSWQSLMKGVRPRLMSPQEIQGLIAELKSLWFFSDIYGWHNAVTSWRGPVQDDRDFVFEDSWAEIKSCAVSAKKVTISSLDQLDVDQCGELHVFRIEKTSETKNDVFSLKELIDETLAALCVPSDKVFLELRLSQTGYDATFPEYSERIYHIVSHSIYSVCLDFPRIRRSTLPAAISDGSYDIVLAGIEKFKKDIGNG